jgi:outer membrane protein X
MKKILFTVVIALLSVLTQAQTFKPFKVDVAFGYAMPSGEGSKGGVLFALEPKYALNDNITLGLRLESALTGNGYEVNGETFSADVKAMGSYLLTGDYYINTNSFRPFVGAGAGLFSVASIKIEDSEAGSAEASGGSKFGFAPRIGFEAGHFRVAGEYNVVGDKSNYAGIKIGFFLGGGRL